jgi:hypothetical protein
MPLSHESKIQTQKGHQHSPASNQFCSRLVLKGCIVRRGARLALGNKAALSFIKASFMGCVSKEIQPWLKVFYEAYELNQP